MRANEYWRRLTVFVDQLLVTARLSERKAATYVGEVMKFLHTYTGTLNNAEAKLLTS